MTTKQLDALKGNKDFAALLKDIKAFREEAISNMENASTERLQQLSGTILAYDSILRSVDGEAMIAYADNIP